MKGTYDPPKYISVEKNKYVQVLRRKVQSTRERGCHQSGWVPEGAVGK